MYRTVRSTGTSRCMEPTAVRPGLPQTDRPSSSSIPGTVTRLRRDALLSIVSAVPPPLRSLEPSPGYGPPPVGPPFRGVPEHPHADGTTGYFGRGLRHDPLPR